MVLAGIYPNKEGMDHRGPTRVDRFQQGRNSWHSRTIRIVLDGTTSAFFSNISFKNPRSLPRISSHATMTRLSWLCPRLFKWFLHNYLDTSAIFFSCSKKIIIAFLVLFWVLFIHHRDLRGSEGMSTFLTSPPNSWQNLTPGMQKMESNRPVEGQERRSSRIFRYWQWHFKLCQPKASHVTLFSDLSPEHSRKSRTTLLLAIMVAGLARIASSRISEHDWSKMVRDEAIMVSLVQILTQDRLKIVLKLCI